MPLFYTDNGFLKAAYAGDTHMLAKYMAKHRKKEHYLKLTDDEGRTGLMLALNSESVAAVDLLLKAGAPLDVEDRYHRQPLIFAFNADNTSQRIALSDALIRAGAKLDEPGNTFYNPLYFAAAYLKDLALSKYLVSKGADINSSSPLQGTIDDTRSAPLALMLIEAGASLESAGKLPLHRAIKAESVLLMQKLKDMGADPKEANAEGQTALHLAAQKGDIEMVAWLLEQGVPADAQDKGGMTALHYAARAGQPQVVEALLAKGARADIGDDKGMTPLAYARQGESQPAMRLLEAKEKETQAREATPLTAAVGTIPANEAETWVMMGEHQVARVGVYPALGRRLTEVFNFESRGMMIISENLKTGAESVTQPEKFDTLEDALLKKALAAFRELGGKADDTVLSRSPGKTPLSGPGA